MLRIFREVAAVGVRIFREVACRRSTVKRRKFLDYVVASPVWVGMLSLSGWIGMIPTRAAAGYPVQAFRMSSVEEILLELFETTDSGEDGGLEILISSEVDNPDLVPFRITARHAEKVAILAENNTHPLVMVTDTRNYPEGVIIGALALQRPSVVSCYVLRQGYLYKNSRRITIAASSY
jgi:hypothetical protein